MALAPDLRGSAGLVSKEMRQGGGGVGKAALFVQPAALVLFHHDHPFPPCFVCVFANVK